MVGIAIATEDELSEAVVQRLVADVQPTLEVREVEAWLLADQQAMRMLLGARGKLPVEPDALPDPKATLLQFAARYAPRDVRADLVQQSGAVASQGIGYNARLVRWVRDDWEPARAAASSPSLHRARMRLQELAIRKAP